MFIEQLLSDKRSCGSPAFLPHYELHFIDVKLCVKYIMSSLFMDKVSVKKYLEALRVKEKNQIESEQHSIIGYDFYSECILLQDSDFVQLTEYVKANIDDIESDVIDQIKFECKTKLENAKNKLENYILTDEEHVKTFSFYIREVESVQKALNVDSVKEYIQTYKKDEFNIYYSLGMESIYLKLIYAKALSYENLNENAIYYKISQLLLKKYSRDYIKENFDYKSLMVSDTVKKELEDIYGKSSLCRYELFKVNFEKHRITNDVLPYIYDKDNVNCFLIIDRKNKRHIDLFNDLIIKGYVKDISLKIDSIMDKLLTFEERSFGQKFSFVLSELPELSLFYDTHAQDNNLWVTVKNEKHKFSITFEETLEDTFYDKNLNVVTNLVHIEVTENNGNAVISHIDHEYIVYGVDTYFNRLKEPTVKGEHKIKTFKIDNAKIPLNYKYQNVNVLLLIINESMSKKELVKEYFENIK